MHIRNCHIPLKIYLGKTNRAGELIIATDIVLMQRTCVDQGKLSPSTGAAAIWLQPTSIPSGNVDPALPDHPIFKEKPNAQTFI